MISFPDTCLLEQTEGQTDLPPEGSELSVIPVSSAAGIQFSVVAGIHSHIAVTVTEQRPTAPAYFTGQTLTATTTDHRHRSQTL